MAELVLERLAKTYANGVQALCDLSLTVADGELIVLVGPSGCGKTTTLRLIAGLEDPTSGTIRLNGRVVNTLPPRERDVAMVFQRSTLYPHLSVRRNLSFGLEMRRRFSWLARLAGWLQSARAEQRAKEDRELRDRVTATGQLVGLADVLERRPNQLSGGQQQRVALGRAIVRQPGVFLLDEPLSQLDGRLRSELRHELHLLQRRLRATMVYVTHDQAEALTLADRVVVLDQGKVQQVDPPLRVYERPANLFVAGFLGWPAMNFAEGRLERLDGAVWFVTATGSLPLAPAGASGLQEHLDKPVTLGIRPEDIAIVGSEPGAARLAMNVVLIECIGHASLVSLQRDGWSITARIPGRLNIDTQDTIEVAFQMDHAHFFDRATGEALRQDRPSG